MINEDDVKIIRKEHGVVHGEFLRAPKNHSYIKEEEIYFTADGVDNFFDYLGKYMKLPPYSYKASDREKEDDDDFYTFDSYKEAWDIFRNRPQEVVKFDPGELKIKDDTEAGNRVDYDVVGDYIDMGRFMEGIPETWGTMHNGNSRNRRVNIILGIDQVAYTSNADIAHRSERILRLVDALEAGGVRVKLTCVNSTQCSHVEIVMKQHGEPLTITDLAVLTNPDFFRRMVFRVIEHSKTIDGGYGHPHVLGQAISNNPAMLHPDNNDEINIFIEGSMNGKENIDKRFNQLERLLAWELNKPVPEVDAIKVDQYGIKFSPNGYRAEAEIKREGQEAIERED